jgi:hypothetical protein
MPKNRKRATANYRTKLSDLIRNSLEPQETRNRGRITAITYLGCRIRIWSGKRFLKPAEEPINSAGEDSHLHAMPAGNL